MAGISCLHTEKKTRRLQQISNLGMVFWVFSSVFLGCNPPKHNHAQVDLKSTYNVESKATPEGSFTTLTADEVQFGAPLSLTGCVGDGKHFLFTEKDNTQITCSDDYYDFENDVFKNLIQCYRKFKEINFCDIS